MKQLIGWIGLLTGIGLGGNLEQSLAANMVIQQMRVVDNSLKRQGFSLTLALERPSFWSEVRVGYRARITRDRHRLIMISDQTCYSASLSYTYLRAIHERSLAKPLGSGNILSAGRWVEMLYWEEPLNHIYIEAYRGETVYVSPSGESVGVRSSHDKRLGIVLQKSRSDCISATWADRSLWALGRGISVRLGTGRSARNLENGHIFLVAGDKEWESGEWRLVIDPKHRYLVVEAELVNTTNGQCVERWRNTGKMGQSIPIAQKAVWTNEPEKQDASFVVECIKYEPCFSEEWYQEVRSRIMRPTKGSSVTDMRVTPFTVFIIK